MTIPAILFAIILAVQFVILYFVLSLVKQVRVADNNNKMRFQKALDRLVAIDKPKVVQSPNEAIEEKEEPALLDENAPWEIPKDVKITVEGGDTLVPPGFEVA
jgi:hypothetical protein